SRCSRYHARELLHGLKSNPSNADDHWSAKRHNRQNSGQGPKQCRVRQPPNGIANTKSNPLTKSNEERPIHGLTNGGCHVHHQSLDGATKQSVNDRGCLSKKGVTV